jgi:hypothetical protein
MNFYKLPNIRQNSRDRTPIKLRDRSFIDKDDDSFIRVNKTPERLITDIKDGYKNHSHLNHTVYDSYGEISRIDLGTNCNFMVNIKEHLREEDIKPLVGNFDYFQIDYIDSYVGSRESKLLRNIDLSDDYNSRRLRIEEQRTKHIEEVEQSVLQEVPVGRALFQKRINHVVRNERNTTSSGKAYIMAGSNKVYLDKPISMKLDDKPLNVKVNQSLNLNINKQDSRSKTPNYVLRLYTGSPKKVIYCLIP